MLIQLRVNITVHDYPDLHKYKKCDPDPHDNKWDPDMQEYKNGIRIRITSFWKRHTWLQHLTNYLV